jgi:hypothetical protein
LSNTVHLITRAAGWCGEPASIGSNCPLFVDATLTFGRLNRERRPLWPS